MKHSNQKWDDFSCNYVEYGFICKIPKLYPAKDSDKPKSKAGAITGVVFGVLIVISIVVAFALFIVKRRPQISIPSITNPLHKMRSNGVKRMRFENGNAEEDTIEVPKSGLHDETDQTYERPKF